MPHAYPRRCEDYNPKLIPRAVSEREFNEALDNLPRIWRGLDAEAMTEFRRLLAQYLAGEFSQKDWADAVRSFGKRHAADG